jgi:hypothetical protein
MNRVHCIKTALLIFVAVTFVSCKSKQEAPKASSVALQQNAGGRKFMSGQNAAGGVVASPQEQADAETAAARVLAQMEAGDFAAIYNGAAPGFKQIGSEAQFVAKFQQTRQKTGPLKNLQEVSFITLPNNTHVLTFSLKNEWFRTERRLTLARANSGKMELLGLNQHDEPTQQAHSK